MMVLLIGVWLIALVVLLLICHDPLYTVYPQLHMQQQCISLQLQPGEKRQVGETSYSPHLSDEKHF